MPRSAFVIGRHRRSGHLQREGNADRQRKAVFDSDDQGLLEAWRIEQEPALGDARQANNEKDRRAKHQSHAEVAVVGARP